MNKDPWSNTYHYHPTFNPIEPDSFCDDNEHLDTDTLSLDSILPDDLLERILAFLPVASIFRAGCVCKRWHDLVSSKRFLWNFSSQTSSQKPWYFMFTGTDESYGYAYDPALRKWHSIDLPYFVTSNWFIASSFGLVCFMNNDVRTDLHVFNPVTRSIRTLIEPPTSDLISDYTALAMSTDKTSHTYEISIVKSKQLPENFFQWDLSIHIYDSETATWDTTLSEVLQGWRAGDESVICGGSLYFLLYSIGGSDNRHGLIKYSLSARSTARSGGLLTGNFIAAPCALTCGRLMNMKERLVLVGGIGKQDRSDIIKGIGIWVLRGGGGARSEWDEVARMPHKYFQGFGELDDVFASSGIEDVVYIQSYGAPALLCFDMQNKQWKWAQKCPVSKRFPLQLFTGFCFEPRLEISP